MESKTNNIKNEFLRKFADFEKHGFYDFIEFREENIGFTIKKKLKREEENASIIIVGIRNQGSLERIPLYIRAIYGKEGDEGITIRSQRETKLTDPINIDSQNEYFYDISEQKLYKNNKEINQFQLLNEIYELHIKPTKFLKGLFLRTKIWFYRILLKKILKLISKIFYYLLLIISGNRYKYEPFLEKEILNDEVIKSRWPEIESLRSERKESLEESKKIIFLNYEASSWSIIFYCLLHLGIYLYFISINYEPLILTKFLGNNFLTLLYVIVSLWFIESVIPKLLMFLIKYFSKLSDFLPYRRIKL